MNEPVLNTLRPLEEIEHESEEEDDNNFDESAEPTTDTPSPAGRRKTNYLTEKPSITKTVSMESSSYGMDPNEIRLAGKLIGLSFTATRQPHLCHYIIDNFLIYSKVWLNEI